MAGLKVYSKDGSAIRCTLAKYQYNGEYMGERTVTSTINSPTKIDWEIGDYIFLRGQYFKIKVTPSAKKQSRRNEYGAGIVYDNVTFQSIIDDLVVIQFKDYVIGDNRLHYSGLGTFAFYMQNIDDLSNRILANLNLAYGEGTWNIIIATEDVYDDNGNILVHGDDEMTIRDQSVSISDGTNLHDALNLYNSMFEINYLVTVIGGVNTIIIGGDTTIDTDSLGYGNGRGLLSLTQSRDDSHAIITRLHAYGSTRNMPYRYYNKFYNNKNSYPKFFGKKDKYLLEAAYINKLMLPYDRWTVESDVYDAYLNSENLEKYGIREGTVTFDGSDEDWDEVYPSIEGMSIDDIRPGMKGYEDGATEETLTPIRKVAKFVAEKCGISYDEAYNAMSYIIPLEPEENLNNQELTELAQNYYFQKKKFPVINYKNFGDTYNPCTEEIARLLFNGHKVYGVKHFNGQRLKDIGVTIYGNADYVDYSLGVYYFGQNIEDYVVTSPITIDGVQYPQTTRYTCKIPYEYITYIGSSVAHPVYHSDWLFVTDYDFRNGNNAMLNNVATDNFIEELFAFIKSALKYSTVSGTFYHNWYAENVVTDTDIYSGGYDISQDQIDAVAAYLERVYPIGEGRLDVILEDENLIDNGISNDGTYDEGSIDTKGKKIETSFVVHIPQLFFNIADFVIEGETPVVSMKTGACAGREFEILDCKVRQNWAEGYDLTLKRDDSDVSSMNMIFPNTTFPIQQGDKFVLLGIKMPPIYVQAAEQRLLRQAQKYLSDYDHEVYQYTPELDNQYLADHPTIANMLQEGLVMTFNDRDAGDDTETAGDLGINEVSRYIKKLTIKYNEGYLPKYEIQLDEDIKAVTLQKVIDKQIARRLLEVKT